MPLNLEQEAGVTEISLNNAKQLIDQHGVPIALDFKANKTQCEYYVLATWEDGFQFCFTGFGWGYPGTGPAGLLKFFDMAHVYSLIPDDLIVDHFGKTDMTWLRLTLDETLEHLHKSLWKK